MTARRHLVGATILSWHQQGDLVVPDPLRVTTIIWESQGNPDTQRRVVGDLIARWDVLPNHDTGDMGIWFLARGLSRLHGSETAMAHLVIERLIEVGATRIGLAVAPGRLAAWVLCHQARSTGNPIMVADHQIDSIRRQFPVGVLCAPGSPAGVDAALVDRLARLGLRTLGQVADLSEADIVGRFGAPGRQAHQWAAGVEPPVSGTVLDTEIFVEMDFEQPMVHTDAVMFAGRQLADELDDRLTRRGEIATAIRIIIDTDHGERVERLWTHAEGLRPGAIADRVRWQLQGWTAGPVLLLRLIAVEVGTERGRQDGWWGGEAHGDERAARAVARLVGLVGDEAVRRWSWRGGRDPVDRYDWVCVSEWQQTRPESRNPTAWPGGLPTPTPAQIFRRARPVQVCDAAGRMVAVSGRGELSAEPASVGVTDTVLSEVVSWAGPWPLEERWWRPTEHRRQARLQLVTADGSALLVHLQHQQWWLRAEYR